MQTCKTELWQNDLWHFFAWRSEGGGGLYSLHDLRSTLTFVKVMSSNSIISVSASRSERQIAAAAGLCWYRQNVFTPPPLWRQRAGRASPRSAARSFKAALKWGKNSDPGTCLRSTLNQPLCPGLPDSCQVGAGEAAQCLIDLWSSCLASADLMYSQYMCVFVYSPLDVPRLLRSRLTSRLTATPPPTPQDAPVNWGGKMPRTKQNNPKNLKGELATVLLRGFLRYFRL